MDVFGYGETVGFLFKKLEVAAVGLLLHRVDVEAHGVFEESAEALENAAGEVGVVFLVEDFEQVVDAHGDADHFFGVSTKVGREPVEFEVV